MKRPKDPTVRLLGRSERRGECLIWLGCINHKGYGQITTGNRTVIVHRYAYRVWVGEIPEGLELDHLCSVRACIEPSHLEPVTHAENVRRALKSECAKGHPYAEFGGMHGRGRYCRKCRSDYRKALRARRREQAA